MEAAAIPADLEEFLHPQEEGLAPMVDEEDEPIRKPKKILKEDKREQAPFASAKPQTAASSSSSSSSASGPRTPVKPEAPKPSPLKEKQKTIPAPVEDEDEEARIKKRKRVDEKTKDDRPTPMDTTATESASLSENQKLWILNAVLTRDALLFTGDKPGVQDHPTWENVLLKALELCPSYSTDPEDGDVKQLPSIFRQFMDGLVTEGRFISRTDKKKTGSSFVFDGSDANLEHNWDLLGQQVADYLFAWNVTLGRNYAEVKAFLEDPDHDHVPYSSIIDKEFAGATTKRRLEDEAMKQNAAKGKRMLNMPFKAVGRLMVDFFRAGIHTGQAMGSVASTLNQLEKRRAVPDL